MKRLFVSLFISILILFGCEEPSNEVTVDSEKQTETKTEEIIEDEREESNEEDETEELNDVSDETENTTDDKSDVSESDESDNNDPESDNQIPVEFVRVVDGDTIKIIYNGVEETVRYLLVDTPESKHPNTCDQPYGKEASARNEELLLSGQVTIEFDGPERDKYDRLLAYVFVDGMSVQKTLLEEGYARIAYVYDPPYKYMNVFQEAEDKARSGGLNIWSIDGFATDDGFTKCEDGSSSKKSSSESSSTNNSANNNSSTPASSGKTENFKNCTELKTVYPDGVPEGHPAYQPKMDRDKDGWACE